METDRNRGSKRMAHLDEMKPWLLGGTLQWLWLLVGEQTVLVAADGTTLDIVSDLIPTTADHFLRVPK